MTTDATPINLFEFEDVARARLPKAEYDYIAGGATDEISVDRNRRAETKFQIVGMRPEDEQIDRVHLFSG